MHRLVHAQRNKQRLQYQERLHGNQQRMLLLFNGVNLNH